MSGIIKVGNKGRIYKADTWYECIIIDSLAHDAKCYIDDILVLETEYVQLLCAKGAAKNTKLYEDNTGCELNFKPEEDVHIDLDFDASFSNFKSIMKR